MDTRDLITERQDAKEAIVEEFNDRFIYSEIEDQEELDVFKTKIQSNISNYKKKIEDTNLRIEQLVKKRNNQGLDISEEEELTKLYILFDELNPEGKDLPANLIHRDSISKLNEFVNETKEILEELKKLNKKK